MSPPTITDLLTARVADLVTCATAQAHESGDRMLADALLDFRYAVTSGVPETVIHAFMALRPRLERVDFMTAFRLRRRLEIRYRVQVTPPGGESSEFLLDLRWRSWALLVGSAKRAVFESSACEDSASLLRGTAVRIV